MQIYIPFSSEYLARTILQDPAVDLGIHMEMEYLGVKRLRNAHPLLKGKPHKAFKVRLFPMSDEYRKLSVRSWNTNYVRRVNAVCWHGYKNYFARLFAANDYMTIRTEYITKGGIEYNGWDDFYKKYAATKDHFYNGYAACRCSGSKLATWEMAEDHLPCKDMVIQTQY